MGLWEVIEGRRAAGPRCCSTTQYLDEADQLADRIAVIDHGRVIAEGTSGELKQRVGGERLEVALADSTHVGRRAALATVHASGPSAEDGVVRVPVSERRGAIARAVRTLDHAGVEFDDSRSVYRPSTTSSSPSRAGRPRRPRPRVRRRARSVARRRRHDEPASIRRCRFPRDRRSGLKRIQRQPDLLTAFTLQPIMFVLLFVYVFGGAIQVPPGFGDYADFMLPGIIVQWMASPASPPRSASART